MMIELFFRAQLQHTVETESSHFIGWQREVSFSHSLLSSVVLRLSAMNPKAFRTIVGGILIHMSIGTVYTASNMITYIISYIHNCLGNAVGGGITLSRCRALLPTCRRGCMPLVLWVRPCRCCLLAASRLRSGQRSAPLLVASAS